MINYKKFLHSLLGVYFAFSLSNSTVFSQHSAPTDSLDFTDTAKAITSTMRSYIYDTHILMTPQYKDVEQQVEQLATRAKTREEFVSGFNNIWQQGPFSHVRLDIARQSAEQLANYLDGMNVGGSGALLTWQDDVAILTVNTMMGQDTIEQINAAYQTIHERKAKALIIDQRHNEGGAFAVRPLVSHIIAANLDAGVFLSQKWTQQNSGTPSSEIIQAAKPWQGWSIKSFWQDVQNDSVTRIMFEPMTPHFEGQVYVLTSQRTASAAELATDALLASGRAVIVGEKTAGKMLSQKMYDLPQGLQLSLPIADYYATRSGRIEGTGVAPTVVIEASKALDKALELAKVGQK